MSAPSAFSRKLTAVRKTTVAAAPPRVHAMNTALEAAASLLARVIGGESLSTDELSQLETAGLRKDVQDLVFGTLRQYGVGDAYLSILLERTPEPLIRALLLVALYRLDSRPDSPFVVVDQAVEAARRMTRGRAAGFVNAVLRAFLRRKEALAQKVDVRQEVKYRHPVWWIERLQRAWPSAWPAIVAAGNEKPPLTLRVNCRRQDPERLLQNMREKGISASPVNGFPWAVRVASGTRIDTSPGFAEGEFAVQDPGAQLAAAWLDPRDGQRVLDACAAPGGKTGHLLELASLDLLAVDLDEARCQRVDENLKRLGHAATVIAADAKKPESWWDGVRFDRILADVPCTASGVVRRHPDIKWLRREEDIDRFVATQSALLAALWPLLEPGGKLLYATCSVFPEENQLQVLAFNATFPEAKVSKQQQLLPCAEHDGFFYALFEKPLA